MKSVVFVCLIGSTVGIAAGLKDFQPGEPARALEINNNFRYLDSVLQKKASQAGVDVVAALVNTKADGALRDSLAAISARIRRDSAAFAGYQAKLREDSLAQAGKLGQVASGLLGKADASALAEFKAKVKQDSAATAVVISGVPTSANIASKLDATAFTTFQSKVKADSGAVAGQIGKLQASVSALPTMANLNLKLDATAFADFQAKVKVDSGSHRAAIASKLDASQATDFVKKSDPAHRLSMVYFNSAASDVIDEGTWYGMGRANLPTLSASPNLTVGSQMQVAGYFGLRLRSSGHILDLPEASYIAPTLDGKEIWHAGNLTVDKIPGAQRDLTATRIGQGTFLSGTEDGRTIHERNANGVHFGRVLNAADAPVGGEYINYLSMPETSSGYSVSYFAASVSNTQVRGWIGRGEFDGAPTWRELAHSGNFNQMAKDNGVLTASGGEIQGDLRISGKLTTTPGATPADYVFEPDYKLAPLAEVEAYTKENKHLPEVPSAAEMTSQGVDLAKMNMVLLKKVEELTLHAISQEKLLDAQRADLLAQKQRLDRLEGR